MRIILLSIFILWSNVTIAQIDSVKYQWEIKKEQDGIIIYTSKVTNSKFRAVKAEMLVKGTVSGLVALVSDNDACPQWADLCEKSETIEVISDTEKYVYSYNNIPFPIKDRDVLAHVIWQYAPSTGKVSMTSTATQDRHPKIKSAVRITKAVTQWHFTPQDDGFVRVDNFAHIDPNGPTPAWVTNLLLVSSPFKTMKNMRKIIETGHYKDVKVKFLP